MDAKQEVDIAEFDLFADCNKAEPVKRNETLSYDGFCRTSSSVTNPLIHPMVWSFGGSGLRLWSRMGLVA
jgi:hypothetical protein